MWSVEEMTSTRTASSSRAAAICTSSSSSIGELIALRTSGRSSCSSATPWGSMSKRVRGSLIGGALLGLVGVSADALDQKLGLGDGRIDQRPDLVAALGEAAEDVAGDDLGVGPLRPADADPQAPEVAAAEAAVEALEAVVAGDAAAQLAADLAERQVDLVVEGDHAVERDTERAARGAGGLAGLVHEGL